MQSCALVTCVTTNTTFALIIFIFIKRFMATPDVSPSQVERGPIKDGPDHQSTFSALIVIFNFLRNGIVASRVQQGHDKTIEEASNTIYEFYEGEVIKKASQKSRKPDEMESLQILLGKYGSFICPFF